MTNYEKNKAQLDMYAVADIAWGVDEDGKVSGCIWKDCADCIFHDEGSCSEKRLNWLQQEYKEPEVEVDWTKVEVDTPVLVRESKEAEWVKRYFAGYCNGEVLVFNNSTTSNNHSYMISWKYAKLAEQENCQK